jgi:hypothetical protein
MWNSHDFLSDTGVTVCAPEAAGFSSLRLQRLADAFSTGLRVPAGG